MKRNRWLSNALIASMTLDLLFVTNLFQVNHRPFDQLLTASSILMYLSAPAMLFNGLAIATQHPFLSGVCVVLYWITAFLSMEGFSLFLIPAFFCLIGTIQLIKHRVMIIKQG